MYNKKAQTLLGPSIALIVTSVIIAIILVAFFFLIKAIPKETPEIASMSSLKAQSAYSLIAYLEAPVSIDGQEIRMAELIRIAKINASYKPALEQETKKIFDRIYGDKYKIEIKDFMYIPYAEFLPKYLSKETIMLKDNIEITLYLKL